MADTRRFALANQLDIEQILVEAQHRWLRPAEICEILRNFKRFRIAPEPANMPPSGSLFLFDRKVLRYFRKDGHNWRKKKDGKTVKEAHERLKVGSIDVLHCYYAHGEENESFQRRSYWMLEEDLSHIVLVHYREVKGNRNHFNRIKETEGDIAPSSDRDSSSSSFPNSYQMPIQSTDTASLSSAQASEYEDSESASSTFQPFFDSQQPFAENIGARVADPYYPIPFQNNYPGKFQTVPGLDYSPLAQANNKIHGNSGGGVALDHQKNLKFQPWDQTLENITARVQVPFQPSFSEPQSDNLEIAQERGQEAYEQFYPNGYSKRQEFLGHPEVQGDWQNLHGGEAYELNPNYQDTSGDQQYQIPEEYPKPESKGGMNSGERSHASGAKQPLLDGVRGEEGLKKLDSFNQWVLDGALEDVTESDMQTSSRADWDTVENENCVDESSQVRLDNYVLSPSLSQDQLFSIIDFSPNWAYENSEVKVLVTGRFLSSGQTENRNWSCMFGEVEVPAEIIAEGVLRCHAPTHKLGRVPFYVTCSNRVACSEVREFEYRVNDIQDVDTRYDQSAYTVEFLSSRFAKLISLDGVPPNSHPVNLEEHYELRSKISFLRENQDGWDQLLKQTSVDDFSFESIQDQLEQKLLKGKLHDWLLQKAGEGGKGPSVLDEGGQGVLHFAAALGYEWALEPTVTAGVSVNFRDANGWTALHWAAFYGREKIVAALIPLGAAPGALTDPSPKYPTGKTPADLASDNGHKGIAGYLAESALSAHLISLNLENKEGKVAEASVVQAVSERTATSTKDGDPDRTALKDSLAAVCNATQAAARIHEVYRVQSFQRKQLEEYDDDKFGMPDERALSRIALKSRKATQRSDERVHADAATRIQNKFRSYKGRKDFLIFRQRVVKIQAHVRGHQVRKNYRKIIWTVGIVEKIILRWRRKGSGLRGFKSEALAEPSTVQGPSKDDDYDFLKEGRKQSEVRMQKALARVKSMVQYPEARNQYRRLLKDVNSIQESKVLYDAIMSTEETPEYGDDYIDLEALLDDDTFMPTSTPP